MVKKIMKFACLFFFLVCQLSAYGQSTYSISGVIRDKNETLPGASIYISNHKIVTQTDLHGRFILKNLPSGNYDVMVHMVGYKPFSQSIDLKVKDVQLQVVLEENVTLLKEVVIQPDPDRAYYLSLFKKNFIGLTPNALQCKIVNEHLLRVDYDKKERVLRVNADDFIILENNALGFRIKYLLKYFEYDFNSRIVFYAGLPHFEEMKGGKSRQKRWMAKREEAYYGSSQHFYRSLYKGEATKEGFIIHKLVETPNPNRPSDSLINAHTTRLTKASFANAGPNRFVISDSLQYWMKLKRAPKSISVLDRRPILLDTLVKENGPALKKISFEDQLYIVYTKERENKEFFNSGASISRPPDIPDYQISTIKLLDPSIAFYEYGSTYDPKGSLFSGYWAYEKMADMVPLDFLPTPKK